VLNERETKILRAIAGSKFDFHLDNISDVARARFQAETRSIIELERDRFLQDGIYCGQVI
jgi:hypothetical protein